MKTAILNIDNTTQIMLYPETDIDIDVIKTLLSKLPMNTIWWDKGETDITIWIKRWVFAESNWWRYRHYEGQWAIIRIDNIKEIPPKSKK